MEPKTGFLFGRVLFVSKISCYMFVCLGVVCSFIYDVWVFNITINVFGDDYLGLLEAWTAFLYVPLILDQISLKQFETCYWFLSNPLYANVRYEICPPKSLLHNTKHQRVSLKIVGRKNTSAFYRNDSLKCLGAFHIFWDTSTSTPSPTMDSMENVTCQFVSANHGATQSCFPGRSLGAPHGDRCWVQIWDN